MATVSQEGATIPLQVTSPISKHNSFTVRLISKSQHTLHVPLHYTIKLATFSLTVANGLLFIPPCSYGPTSLSHSMRDTRTLMSPPSNKSFSFSAAFSTLSLEPMSLSPWQQTNPIFQRLYTFQSTTTVFICYFYVLRMCHMLLHISHSQYIEKTNKHNV